MADYIRLKLKCGAQEIEFGDGVLDLFENGFHDEGQTVSLELRVHDPTGIGAVQKRLGDIARFIAQAREYEATKRGDAVKLEAWLDIGIDQIPSLGRGPVWKRVTDGRIEPIQSKWYTLKSHDRCTVILETAPVRTSKGFTYAWRGQERMLPYAKGFVEPRKDGGINLWRNARNIIYNPVFNYTDSDGEEDYDYGWSAEAGLTVAECYDDHYILYGHRSAKLTADTADRKFYVTKSVTSGKKILHGFYAYTNGSAVTSADCVAYLDGAQASTYEAVDGHPGWYRVYAITTTPDTSVEIGVQVKAGKTVYVDGMFAIVAPPSTGWWDAAYTKKRQITISAATANAISAGDCVKLSISGADAADIYNACLATGDDFRIIHDNGAETYTEKDRYLQTFSSTSIVVYFKCHVDVAAGTNNTQHYIYYSNPAAATPTLTNPFIYYRSLDSLTDFTELTDAVWSVVNGVARCTPAANSTNYNLLVTAPFDSLPTIYELAVEQRCSRQGTQFDYNGPCVRDALSANYYESGHWNGGQNMWKLVNASTTTVASEADNTFDERNWHHYALKVTSGGGADLEVDHVSKITQASGWGGNATWKYLGIFSRTDDTSGAPYFEFRNLWLRKRWATEPTVSAGAATDLPIEDMPNDYPFFYGDTPYCNWDGAADNSASQCDGGRLKYRADQYIAAERGTIYIVWTAKWGYDRIGDITFFHVDTLRGYYDATNDRFKLTDGTNTAQSSIQTFAAGDQLCIAFTWDAGATNKLRIDLNGATNGTAAAFRPPTITTSTGLYLGSKSDTTEQCGQINEVIISERGKVFSAAEVAALWSKGVGHGEIDYLWVWDGAGSLINHEDSAVHKNSFYIRHAGGDEEAGLALIMKSDNGQAEFIVSQRRHEPHWWTHWLEAENAEEFGTSGTVTQTESDAASNGYYELWTPADANWTDGRILLHKIRDVDCRDRQRWYGTYDIFARLYDESTAVYFQSKIKPQMAYSDSYTHTARWNDPASPSAVGQWEMVYLGRITFPPAAEGDYRNPHLNKWGSAYDPYLLIAQKVKRSSGTAGLRVDALVLLDGDHICKGAKIYYGYDWLLMDTISEVPYVGGVEEAGEPEEFDRWVIRSPFKHSGHWLYAEPDKEAKYAIIVSRDNNIHNIADTIEVLGYLQSRYSKIVR